MYGGREDRNVIILPWVSIVRKWSGKKESDLFQDFINPKR